MPELIYFFPPDCDCVGIFERFYHEWNRTLFRHVITKVPNYDYDLTCEVCQQVWTEIWQGIRANTLLYLMPGLLVCKADSRIKDHYRRAARLRQLDPAKHDRADRPNLDERIDHQTALSALPDDERNIFALCFREGFTQEEVAARLAVSTRTVRRKLDAALTHLQEFLQGETAAAKSSER